MWMECVELQFSNMNSEAAKLESHLVSKNPLEIVVLRTTRSWIFFVHIVKIVLLFFVIDGFSFANVWILARSVMSGKEKGVLGQDP